MAAIVRSLQGAKRAIKDLAYDDVEILLRDATSNDPNGPSVEVLEQVCRVCREPRFYYRVWSILWKRVNDTSQKLHVLKGLTVCLYLLQNVKSQRASQRLRQDILANKRDLWKLFDYYDPSGKTMGGDVRELAMDLYELVTGEQVRPPPKKEPEKEKVKEEKPKPKKEKPKVASPKSDDFAEFDKLDWNKPSQGGAQFSRSDFDAFDDFKVTHEAWNSPRKDEPLFDLSALTVSEPVRTPAPTPVVQQPVVQPVVQPQPKVQEVKKPVVKEEKKAPPPVVQEPPKEKPVEKLEKPPQQLAARTSVSERKASINPVRVGLKAELQAEVSIFARYLNHVCQPVDTPDFELDLGQCGALPIDDNDSDLLYKVRSGLVLGRLINRTAPQTIDERALNADVTLPPVLSTASLSGEDREKLLQNNALVISAAKSIGVFSKVMQPEMLLDIDQPNNLKVALYFIWQLIRAHVLRNMSLVETAELAAITTLPTTNPPSPDETMDITQLSKLLPEQLLLRWFMYHLRAEGDTRTQLDLRDPRCYGVLLNSIHKWHCRAYNTECFQIAINQQHTDPPIQQLIIYSSNLLGVPLLLKQSDVGGGNPRMNLLFSACIFNACCALDLPDSDPAESPNSPLSPKLDRDLADQYGDNVEARAFVLWINSLELDGVFVRDLFTDLRDGMVLLKVVDHVVARPGFVDWKKRVEMKPTSRFKCVSNCNYVIDLGKLLRFSVVNMGGVDIVDGKRKLTLGFVWQLMRLHILLFLTRLSSTVKERRRLSSTFQAGDPGDVDLDTMLIEWAQQKLSEQLQQQQQQQQQQQKRQSTVGKAPQTSQTSVSGSFKSAFYYPKGLSSFKDKQLSDSIILLRLLECVVPNHKFVKWEHVVLPQPPSSSSSSSSEGGAGGGEGMSEKDKMLNAGYTISLARKLGATLFLLPEDIVSVKPKMILTFVASLMAVDLQRESEKQIKQQQQQQQQLQQPAGATGRRASDALDLQVDYSQGAVQIGNKERQG